MRPVKKIADAPEASRETLTQDRKKDLLLFLRDVAIFFVLSVALVKFVAQPIVVSGTSMLPTLQHRDLAFGLRLNVEDRLQHGDIAVVENTLYGKTELLIKRVIGLPGDKVDIDYAEGTVSVNGEVLDEP